MQACRDQRGNLIPCALITGTRARNVFQRGWNYAREENILHLFSHHSFPVSTVHSYISIKGRWFYIYKEPTKVWVGVLKLFHGVDIIICTSFSCRWEDWGLAWLSNFPKITVGMKLCIHLSTFIASPNFIGSSAIIICTRGEKAINNLLPLSSKMKN